MDFLKRLFAPVTATVSFIQNHFKAMIFLLIVVLIFMPSSEEGFKVNNLRHLTFKGPILDATGIVEELEAAQNDAHIKGVLLEIDSPGGAVAPSLEIAYAVKRLKEHKPVVVYGSGLLASGGYYAAIWADKIVANPGAMVGSIGVIMQGANLQGLMEKIGIGTQVVKAGQYKQVGTVDRPWSEAERNELEKVIKGTYEMFVNDVASARSLDPAKEKIFADAHIFTASQALDVGLVDSLGVRFDARREVETLSGVSAPSWNKEDRFERFMKQLGSETASLLHTYFPALTLR